ncbi:hypothetical protein [Halobaculum gomorrense]|uniref:Uncharacterized protein n=1 Tax=Halobaculum gomorrense TaxID=43928 RepID=A0A1M5PBB9_9EURY|nr:hypothetical protein [Halobaculum gomorrense]SHG99131.1 hypothetical protein SAMN05443636_1535 [Halobaculum gomorrense]
MPSRRADAKFEFDVELGALKYRPVDWLLLSGNRLLVSGLLIGFVAAVLAWAVVSGLAPLRERTPVLFLLFALIGGNFTLISIVVSISQFVLSRHLESPGEIRSGLREMVEYRRYVSEATGESVVPVSPSAFMSLLFGNVKRELERLRGIEWEGANADLRSEGKMLSDELEAHAEHVLWLLRGSDRGTRYALLAVLDTNYSRYFDAAYRIRAEYDDLPPSAAESLNTLERTVEQIDVARRYFKTVFIQSELASLSRRLLYVGIPVQIVSVVLMLLFTVPEGGPFPVPAADLVIPAVVTAGFTPIVLLTAYFLRLATLVRRTAAMYPFTNSVDR